MAEQQIQKEKKWSEEDDDEEEENWKFLSLYTRDISVSLSEMQN